MSKDDIKYKVRRALWDATEKKINGDIWKDEEVEVAKDFIKERLTDEELDEIKDNAYVGRDTANDELVAKVRGEVLRPRRHSRSETEERMKEFRSMIQEEVEAGI